MHLHSLTNGSQRSKPLPSPGELAPPIVGEGAVVLENRLTRIESLLEAISKAVMSKQVVKEFYTTTEAAKVLGKRPFTVREWCRLSRVHAKKTHAGHGIDAEWRISHEELLRIQNEGLLPIPARY